MLDANAARSSNLARRILAIVAIATLFVIGACRNGSEVVYSADPITAWVIDADNNKPLAGVNVVAGWEIEGGIEGYSTVGWFKVTESVTDASGKFELPGWGPEWKRITGSIGNGAPRLILFKDGYELQRLLNPNVLERADSHTASYWNGKVIGLQPRRGTVQQYAADLVPALDLEINGLLANDECNWRAIPKFLLAVVRQDRGFAAMGIKRRVGDLDYLNGRYKRGQCGSLKEYVEVHG